MLSNSLHRFGLKDQCDEEPKKRHVINLNSCLEFLTYVLVLLCSIQIITKFGMIVITNDIDFNLDDTTNDNIYSVKEYELKLSDLAKILDNHESMLLPGGSNNGESIIQNFKVTFHDTDSSTPSISITSTMFMTENSEDSSNKTPHFSTVKINLNQNKQQPDSIQFFTGVKKQFKNISEKSFLNGL